MVFLGVLCAFVVKLLYGKKEHLVVDKSKENIRDISRRATVEDPHSEELRLNSSTNRTAPSIPPL